MASTSTGAPEDPPMTPGSLLARPKLHRQTRSQTNGGVGPGSLKAKADPSVLRPSIAISVTGLKQAVKVLETGTKEV